MSAPTILPTRLTIPVEPWRDHVVETLGFYVRSGYVERFWLGILGPTATWALWALTTAQPEGWWVRDERGSPTNHVDLARLGRHLGVKAEGARSPLLRAIGRLVIFGAARWSDGGTLYVRHWLAPLSQSQVRRLPEWLRDEHDQAMAAVEASRAES